VLTLAISFPFPPREILPKDNQLRLFSLSLSLSLSLALALARARSPSRSLSVSGCNLCGSLRICFWSQSAKPEGMGFTGLKVPEGVARTGP
jgi:hypothetical protein